MVYSLASMYFDIPQLGMQQKQTLDYWSRNMLNFDFLEKDVAIVSTPYFVHDFSRKMVLIWYSIDWPNFIVWLPLLLEILGNICVAIACFTSCDVKDFEIKGVLPGLIQLLGNWKEAMTKTQISSERNELLRWNKKHFSSILKGFQIKEVWRK